MAARTFAIGDIHGDLYQLYRLLAGLPELDSRDTLVFMGDYMDRGLHSARVVDYIRRLPSVTPAKVIALRGNHEDAWLRVVDVGWDEFVLPPPNGCLAAYRSFVGGPPPVEEEVPTANERVMLSSGAFLPEDVVQWFRSLPFWYEDDHAIYVHAGIPLGVDGFPHPSAAVVPEALLWCRDEAFFTAYRGKRVVFGHTITEYLAEAYPDGVQSPEVAIWAMGDVVGVDTGCGHGGVLSALELPSMRVYDSR